MSLSLEKIQVRGKEWDCENYFGYKINIIQFIISYSI